MLSKLAPAHYPYTGTKALIRQIKCITEEALRKRVLRCRNKITQLARNAGQPPPSVDAVIESSQWHGYRLNPDRIRVGGRLRVVRERIGHASQPKGHASLLRSPLIKALGGRERHDFLLERPQIEWRFASMDIPQCRAIARRRRGYLDGHDRY